MTKEYRPWTPEQAYLLPPSPMQWLPEGHLAYFVLDLVCELDVSGIEHAIQSKDGRGTRPYSPRMMTALFLYAYCVGVFSLSLGRAKHDSPQAMRGRLVAQATRGCASTPRDHPLRRRRRSRRGAEVVSRVRDSSTNHGLGTLGSEPVDE